MRVIFTIVTTRDVIPESEGLRAEPYLSVGGTSPAVPPSEHHTMVKARVQITPWNLQNPVSTAFTSV